MRFEGFIKGVNLGHWISQYGSHTEEHFDSYIIESDLERIAELGFDHVRLPIDYMLFVRDEEKPFEYDETRLLYIENTIRWCEKYHLNIVLDLHHVPGYFFGDGEQNTLFVDPEKQKQFEGIWVYFAKRWGGCKHVAFELMNELVAPNSDGWNALFLRLIQAIRQYTKTTPIIVGGNYFNAVDQLQNLVVVEDPFVIYNFHFYLPMEFTHQKAPWIEGLKEYTEPVHYPFSPKDYLQMHSDSEERIDRAWLLGHLQPAIEFMKKEHRPLYCGEFGVIGYAEVEDAKAWCQDLLSIFREYGIGHAFWSYRGFSKLTLPNRELSDPEYARILTEQI